MAKTYRTANGKIVDLDKVRLSNENTIAVGNMKVNARGDQLGAGGQVIQTRNQSMDQYYKVHSPVVNAKTQQVTRNQTNAGAQVTQGTIKPKSAPPPVSELDPDGVPFDQPDTAHKTPELRGSLADSIAKSTGPKRI